MVLRKAGFYDQGWKLNPHCSWQPRWEQVYMCLTNPESDLLHNSTILIPGKYLEDTESECNQDTCAAMFLWHAVHNAKLQIQQRRLQEIMSVCTVSCGSAIKKKEIVLFARSGLRLRSAITITVHSKISKAQKDESCVFSKMWNLKKKA